MAKFSAAKRRHVKNHHPKRDDYKTAEKFAKVVNRDLDEFVRAIVVFGSVAKDSTSSMSDIDVLIIIDDVSFKITTEMTEAYRLVVQGHAKKTSPRLHINTLKLSNFWEYVRIGDPVVINMLRDGHALVDKGFFEPAQLLLQQGRIRPTRESIWTYYSRTTHTLQSARKHLLSSCVDLYWAAMDASHAALMSIGEMPPSPEHVADLLEKKLAKKKLIAKSHPKLMRELYELQKAIQQRELREISGEQYDIYWKETLRLVSALRTVVERHPPSV